jgi:hypothetical protein
MTYGYYTPGGLNLSKNYCIFYVIIVLLISRLPLYKTIVINHDTWYPPRGRREDSYVKIDGLLDQHIL